MVLRKGLFLRLMDVCWNDREVFESITRLKGSYRPTQNDKPNTPASEIGDKILDSTRTFLLDLVKVVLGDCAYICSWTGLQSLC